MGKREKIGHMSKVPIRPTVERIPIYVPGKRADTGVLAQKLSSNESPFPPLPGVIAAVADAAAELNRYPQAFSDHLVDALAGFYQVEFEQVAVGPGSLGLLSAMMTAFSAEGTDVVYPWRSFEAYPIITAAAGANDITVPLGPAGRVDLDALARAITPNTRIVIVCTPNNPTGPSVGTDEFIAFMKRVPANVLVAVDNAYAEFATDPAALDPLTLLDQYPNMVVFRTFSKAYGLAGLRVGYALGRQRVISAIRATTMPFAVNSLAQVAASTSLRLQDDLRGRVAAIVEVRDQLRLGLVDQGWKVPESDGNFVWLPAGAEAEPLTAALGAAGLLVRGFAGSGVRITAAGPESIEQVLAVTQSWV